MRYNASMAGLYNTQIKKNDPDILDFINKYKTLSRNDSRIMQDMLKSRLRNILGSLQILDKYNDAYINMDRIKAKFINIFFEKLYKAKYGGSGVDNYIRALRTFLDYAIGQSDFKNEVIQEMKLIKEKLIMTKKGASKQITLDIASKSYNVLVCNEVLPSVATIQKILVDDNLLKTINEIMLRLTAEI